MAYLTYDDYWKNSKKALQNEWNSALADNNTLHKEQKTNTENTYNAKIDEAKKAYEDNYRESAIQKIINEREVAENMANMGLTTSGLDRIQSRAVKLSYEKSKASIDKQKQAQVDALAKALASELSSIEQSRLSSAASINQKYEQKVTKSADEAYSSAIKAQEKRA